MKVVRLILSCVVNVPIMVMAMLMIGVFSSFSGRTFLSSFMQFSPVLCTIILFHLIVLSILKPCLFTAYTKQSWPSG